MGIGLYGALFDEYTCDDGGKTMAAIKVQDAVKNRLYAPGKADFPKIYDEAVRILGKHRYRYESYVDAENMYGGTIRVYFSGEAECTPKANWRVFNLELY